ncbi:MAG: hypothetical protein R6V77_00360 [Candidatus Cloacimonadaceae bacterium]
MMEKLPEGRTTNNVIPVTQIRAPRLFQDVTPPIEAIRSQYAIITD